MIRPEIITRDDARGLTYFVAELREDAFALFSLFDSEAADGQAATLEIVGASIDEIFKAMKDAFREQARSKNGAQPSDEDESAEASDEADDAVKPVRRRRRQLS